jgi:hypothetical protein
VTTNLRQRLDKALDEAARWRQFAADTQAVNIHLQQALDRYAIGCPDCNYTGLVDAIDPQTGAVYKEICGNCRTAVDRLMDVYLGWREE